MANCRQDGELQAARFPALSTLSLHCHHFCQPTSHCSVNIQSRDQSIISAHHCVWNLLDKPQDSWQQFCMNDISLISKCRDYGIKELPRIDKTGKQRKRLNFEDFPAWQTWWRLFLSWPLDAIFGGPKLHWCCLGNNSSLDQNLIKEGKKIINVMQKFFIFG